MIEMVIDKILAVFYCQTTPVRRKHKKREKLHDRGLIEGNEHFARRKARLNRVMIRSISSEVDR